MLELLNVKSCIFINLAKYQKLHCSLILLRVKFSCLIILVYKSCMFIKLAKSFVIIFYSVVLLCVL